MLSRYDVGLEDAHGNPIKPSHPMSIDHGKLLALANGVKQHITWRENGVSRVPSLAEMREWESTFRALAQPAEAVELPTPYHYADGGKGEPLFTANQVRAAVAVAADAAQGAVAPVSNELIEAASRHACRVQGINPDAKWLQGLDERQWQRLSGTVHAALHYARLTHPQAAPAQGDGWRLVPEYPTVEMLIAGAVARARDAGDDHHDDAKLIYEAMIAAAPSQEGES